MDTAALGMLINCVNTWLYSFIFTIYSVSLVVIPSVLKLMQVCLGLQTAVSANFPPPDKICEKSYLCKMLL